LGILTARPARYEPDMNMYGYGINDPVKQQRFLRSYEDVPTGFGCSVRAIHFMMAQAELWFPI